MLNENTAKRLLAAGKPATGMWLNIPSVNSAEALATIGWDWLTLDVEHGRYNVETQQAPAEVVERIGQGFPFLACQNDVAFLMGGATAAGKTVAEAR